MVGRVGVLKALCRGLGWGWDLQELRLRRAHDKLRCCGRDCDGLGLASGLKTPLEARFFQSHKHIIEALFRDDTTVLVERAFVTARCYYLILIGFASVLYHSGTYDNSTYRHLLLQGSQEPIDARDITIVLLQYMLEVN